MRNVNIALVLIGLAGIAYAADPSPATQPSAAAAGCCAKGGTDGQNGPMMACMAPGGMMEGMMAAKHKAANPSTQPTTAPSDEHAAHHH